MEQLQKEVPEVREEEEEEEKTVMVASGASDPSAGPDNSLPSSSYTGERSRELVCAGSARHRVLWAACSAANGVWLVIISSLCEITHREPSCGEAYFLLCGHCTAAGSRLGDRWKLK